MAQNWFTEVGEELVGIGVEAVSEENLDAAGEVLVSTGAAIVNTERVKRFLVSILLLIPAPLRDRIPEAARWKIALVKTTLKRYARKAMRRRNVPDNIVFMVVDAIDDLLETLKRHTEDRLTDDSLKNYVNTSVDHAVTNPSTPTAARRATQGASMNFTLPPGAEVLDQHTAALIAVMRPVGIRRFNLVWSRLHDAVHADAPDEMNGASVLQEAVRVLFALNSTAAVDLLQRTDLRESPNLREDDAIVAFLAAAVHYLPDPSLKAIARDAADKLLSGETREAVRSTVNRAARWGGRILQALAWAFLLSLGAAAICAGMSVWNLVTGAMTDNLIEVGKALGWCFGFLLALAIALGIWTAFKQAAMKVAGAIGEPIAVFKSILTTAAAAVGFNLNPPAAP